MTSFEKESRALTAAIENRPVDWSDVAENYDLKKQTAASANHRLGSNPAWGLDAYRRGDQKTVNDVLDWTTWWVTQPLHENESLTPHPAYRTRIDTGTQALALLAHLNGKADLLSKLLLRNRSSVAHALLGIAKGPAKAVVNLDPQPENEPHILVGNGDNLMAGSVPPVGATDKRGWVREDSPDGHTGPFQGLNDLHLSVLIGQALGLPYGSGSAEQKRNFDGLQKRAPLAPWGVSSSDKEFALKYLSSPTDKKLAFAIFNWTLHCLPTDPYTFVRRTSGAVEVVTRHAHKSSTGTLAVSIIREDGTRLLASPDDGQRGGNNDSNHLRELETIEHPTEWETRWVSDHNRKLFVPRTTGDVAWRIDYDAPNSVFSGGGVTPIPPTPIPPTPGPNKMKLTDLGFTSIGEGLYGSNNPKLNVREIHGDANYLKRWVTEEKG